ncbi:hypothetical protein [Streptosporangium sp. NPDC049078]|uniref:hypothetical protein n=1 Tax=Streptosporangium sp. NPDC049078 TaxID=3155767 RepID=UPI003431F4FA
MTNDQRHGSRWQDCSRVTRPVEILVSALVVGAGFGAATSLVNALSHSYADLESRAYTTSGWSIAEIMSVLLDVEAGRVVLLADPGVGGHGSIF